MIDVIPEPVDIPVPTSFADAKKNIRNTPPLARQMTSEDDLSADEVVVDVSGPADADLEGFLAAISVCRVGPWSCNRLRCPLARMSGLQCFNTGHNGHGINLYGISMTLMGN